MFCSHERLNRRFRYDTRDKISELSERLLKVELKLKMNDFEARADAKGKEPKRQETFDEWFEDAKAELFPKQAKTSPQTSSGKSSEQQQIREPPYDAFILPSCPSFPLDYGNADRNGIFSPKAKNPPDRDEKEQRSGSGTAFATSDEQIRQCEEGIRNLEMGVAKQKEMLNTLKKKRETERLSTSVLHSLGAGRG